jgi:putrescine transport system ATP-binding protein
MTDAPLLSIKGASKRFGAVTALEDVSLDVGAGEFFALLGPSGCGKTTLMRLVAGFETLDAGTVEIDGRDVSGAPPHRRPVNLMFQSYALFPHLSVFENIAFGLRRQGAGKSEIAARVGELLQIVRLEGVETRKPDQLSGGQRQRVALARALAPRPRLLLLDEPLGALDRQLREETQFQIKEIQRRLKTSFVVVTHDQDEALAMADRMAVMRAGRIEQIGAPAEVYERPATRFVAAFIGQMNFLEGRIESGSFVGSFGRLPAGEVGLREGARAVLALRPERVAMAPANRSLDGFEGVVEDVAFRGETTLFRLRLAGGETVRVSRSANDASFSIGDAARISFAPAAARLFASE